MTVTLKSANSYFTKVLNNTSGYVNAGGLNGRDVSWIDSCTCCCIVGGGNGKDDGIVALVIVVMMLAVSFFVGLFFTVNSVDSAIESQSKIRKARRDISHLEQQCQPPVNPAFYQQSVHIAGQRSMFHEIPVGGQQPSAPPMEGADFQSLREELYDPFVNNAAPAFAPPSANPEIRDIQDINYELRNLETQLLSRYHDAKVLLKGRRDERIVAAVSQAIMTAGVGMLTVALLTAFVIEPQFWMIASGAAGCGAIVLGAFIYVAKMCIPKDCEEEAADNISKWLIEYARYSSKNAAAERGNQRQFARAW